MATPHRVALVNMPFCSIWRPSIQLGILKAIAARQLISADTYHLNLDLAKIIGVDEYEALGEFRGRQIGEWLFSLCAFGDAAPDPNDEFLDQFSHDISSILNTKRAREFLTRIRHTVMPDYLGRLVKSIDWQIYRVVGFTCTYQQTVASIALARLLKSRYPRIVTVFGGANMDGEMGIELLKGTPSIDYIIQGEGEISFQRFLDAIQNNEDPALTKGVRASSVLDVPSQTSLPVEELDAVPIPEYSEYFDRCDSLGLLETVRQHGRIPFESSRGCWWGEKYHCVFCGLTAGSMQFREKSASRTLTELEYLGRRYGTGRFQAVDNILSARYFKTVLPRLSQLDTKCDIFYEVKANISKDQVEQLAKSGIASVQPGIESFSDRVLALMKKGTTALQNINVLRWCTYYGLKVVWNLLWGVPGEVPADYHDQLDLLPLLHHLVPSQAAGRIRMERFSPLYSDHRALIGLTISPEASYAYVYPEQMDKCALAYFFDAEFDDGLDENLATSLLERVAAWQKAWNSWHPRLEYYKGPEDFRLSDSRQSPVPRELSYPPKWAEVYNCVSPRPTTREFVVTALSCVIAESEVDEALSHFCSDGVVWRCGTRYLALGLPAC